MKKVVLAIILCLSFINGFSQWHFINPIPSNASILAITFTDSLTGFTAGDKGQILKTTDGGLTWKITNMDLKKSITLYDIKFLNAQIGYACGVYEAIYKTIDGGESWQLQHYNLAAGQSYGTLETIYIYDSQTVYMGGSVGLFYASNNGGATWEKRQNAATTYTPRAMHFTSRDTGLVINSGTTGFIRKTNNGGYTWSNDTIPGISPNAFFYDIKFLNKDTAFICGTGKILKTIDGGLNWTVTNVNSTHTLYSIYFADDLHGYIYGYSVLYKTADGGQTWTAIPVVGVTPSGCRHNRFIDSNTVVTGIRADYIKKTTDCGQTWNVLSTNQLPIGTQCYSVFFTDQQTGYVAGASGKIFKTTDGAVTWNVQATPTPEILNAIWFINKDTGFVAADDGVFLRTNDGGATWTDIYTGLKFWNDVMFPSQLVGYRVGNAGAAEKTIDGGTSWISLPVGTTANIISVKFINDTIGYISGGVFKKTTDGGQTWTTIVGSGVFGNQIWCMSADTVISGGSSGTVTRTTDGLTYYQVTDLGDHQITSVYCTDSHHCYSGDIRGNVFYSTDGGVSWVQQRAPTVTPIHSFFFTSSSVGYAFSEGNGLIKTGNGGGLSEIEGQCFVDANYNGIRDSGEVAAPGFILSVNNGQNTFTAGNSDSLGYYSFGVAPGNYTISVAHNPPYYSIVPNSHTANFNQAMDIDTLNDFAFQPISTTTDVRVELIGQTRLRKPTDVLFNISYANKGTQIADGKIKMLVDQNLSFMSANPTPIISGDTLIWNYSGLGLFELRQINVIAHLSTAVPSLTQLQNTVFITTLNNDSVMIDNFDTLNQGIMAPLDPNSKSVEPETVFTTQDIVDGKYLNYTINFQNIGNDTAFNIVIVDTMSNLLDVGTFEILGSSFPVVWQLTAPSTFKFMFNNIMLPDSIVNEAASHGYIKYKIKPKSSLLVNDMINNTAGIYFDYEPAVITNTTSTIITQPASLISDHYNGKQSFSVIPNPFHNSAQLIFNNKNNEIVTIKLFDVTGRIRQINTTKGSEFNITVQDIAKGVYVIELTIGNDVMRQKVIVY